MLSACNSLEERVVQPIKFFIVDDDISLLKLMGFLIETAGYEVELCPSGNSALLMIPEENPDCLITDYSMIGTNGAELIRELKKDSKFAKIKTIIVSSDSMISKISEKDKAKIDGYIFKPFDADTFVDDVLKIYRG